MLIFPTHFECFYRSLPRLYLFCYVGEQLLVESIKQPSAGFVQCIYKKKKYSNLLNHEQQEDHGYSVFCTVIVCSDLVKKIKQDKNTLF